MTVLRAAAFRIAVRDLDVARRFYRDDLGLTERSAGPTWLIFDAGVDVIVEPVTGDEDDEISVGRFTRISFAVTDIEAMCAALDERGAQMIGMPETQPWGGVLAHVADPDGNVLTLVQYPQS